MEVAAGEWSKGRAGDGEDALLLREFAHRAYNEIAVATSAVALAGRAADGGEALLAEARHRLESVGALLGLLAKPVELRVDVASELVGLCRAMRAARPDADRTALDLDLPETWVTGAAARRILLVAAELLSNAFRYALAGRDGTLSVTLRRTARDLVLDVRDDGPGERRIGPHGAGLGLGRGIVAELVQRSGGSIDVRKGDVGTLARVRIPDFRHRGVPVPHEAPITGVLLRDLVQCERRIHHDLHGSPALRDEVSDFVRMLCDGGTVHEARILAALPGGVLDLRTEPLASRTAATLAALDRDGVDWIVGARLELGDRVGHPDLLRREGEIWFAGDVKSGGAFAEDGRSPKVEYAVQVAHYAALMGELGAGASDRAFVIGRDGVPAWYDLTAARGRGKGDWIDLVTALTETARGIREGIVTTKGALSSTCAMCHWKTVCRRELDGADDLTLIAGLGRAARSAIVPVASTVAALAALDLEGDPELGRGLPRVGAGQLRRFRDRARLLATPGAAPYARKPLGVRRHARELHFDLESDPLDDGFVYLHGVLVRETTPDGDVERYYHFFAEGRDGERDAFAQAWAFLHADRDAHIFYYSKFERTSYRTLQSRYPEVCAPEEVEALFDPARSTDLLFDVVMPDTEWPTNSLGIKALAKFLGFSWRDRDASGAASIAWFHDYVETRNPSVRQRILDYNEDDCRATGALLDALIALPVGAPAWLADHVSDVGEAS